MALTNSSKAVVNQYAYTPFGKIIDQLENGIPQPFKYVGQYGIMAEPNGLYYMRARYYDPQVHRFISEDPSGFGGGDVNLYAYVANNPIIFVDPLGLNKNEGSVKAIQALEVGNNVASAIFLGLMIDPPTAPIGALGLAVTGGYGLALGYTDAALSQDTGKALMTTIEAIGGKVAGRAIIKMSGLSDATFNYGAMRYASPETGRFIKSAAGAVALGLKNAGEAITSGVIQIMSSVNGGGR